MNTGEELDFDLYPELIRINSIGDGDCFFHSVMNALYSEYKNSDTVKRKKLIKELKDSLIIYLESEYKNLSRGNLESFSTEIPEFSLENMKKELSLSTPIDNKYNELVSNYLSIDIYLLDYEKQRRYITGQDDDILIKDRNSIIILVLPGHYEFVGVRKSEFTVQTVFHPDHPLIKKLRSK